ncbi:MAG: hypothetical protein WCG95_04485 [bacterium]
MQKISSISFKGIEQNQTPKNNVNISNPIEKELGVQALPVGDKSLAINPSLPSDLLGEADLVRYKNIQSEWAQSMSKRLGVPVENILARLPEAKTGDVKTMLATSHLGQFKSSKNTIEINPIRELVNLAGGDDAKIVHESTHGFYHNLRRAYARQLPPEQLYQELANIVVTRMRQGEHGQIINSFQSSNVNGQTVWTPKLMTAPSLSAQERTVLLNTLNFLQVEHLDLNTAKLNDAGKTFVKENLLPYLTDYSKHVIAEPEKKDEKICKKMVDYLDSFFTRRNLLIAHLTSPEWIDVEKNIQTPLTQTEQNMARNSLDGLLSTQEGNYITQQDSLGISDNSLKSYFTSYEEIIARKEENIHRLGKVNQKIKDIKAKGVTPSANLLLEKQTAETNLKLLSLTRELDAVEKQIIGSEINPEKILEIGRIKQEMKSLVDANKKIKDISKYIDFNEVKRNVKTEEDFVRMVEGKVPTELKKDCASFVETLKKLELLNQQINQLDSPEKLLADTAENITLRSQFDNLMAKIRELSIKCDLIGMPRQFFNSDADCMKVNEQAIQCLQKWAKQIL